MIKEKMQQQNFSIIAPGQVTRELAGPNVILVDARGGADATERYRTAHIEGAVMVNLETDLSEIGPDAARGGRHPLPDPSVFGGLLGRLGITPSTRILVYDDKAGANAAARFWWMMKAAGHREVQVVDGGLAAMIDVGLPVSKGPASPPTPAEPYPVEAWQLPTADIDTVDRLRTDPQSLVIDVRENYRYRGESEPIDLVAGHIPGAINIPFLNNLEASGHFRSPKELADQYSLAIGDRNVKNIIVHCGSGVTACHTLLAMDSAGLPLPKLYVGSWSEWSRNEKPVAKGTP